MASVGARQFGDAINGLGRQRSGISAEEAVPEGEHPAEIGIALDRRD